MSFRDCIETAAASGRLSRKKADEALDAYQEAVDDGIAAGLAPDVAEAQAALKAVEATTTLKSAQRWARINDMQKQHALYTRMNESKNPKRELENIAQESVNIYRAVSGQLERMVDGILMKYSPKMAGTVTPTAGMSDIVFGIFGRGVNPEAQIMADATKELIETMRKMQNLEGAAIPANPNFRLWQSHDRGLVHEVGEDVWVAEHLADDVLDWDIMEYGGKAIPIDKREEILRSTYKSIVTDGRHKLSPAIASNETLASRLSRERFLYYKTPEGWLQMQQKYGTGNFFHQLVEHIDSAARNISLMRTYGPNPKTGKGFLERVAQKRSAELELAQPKKANKLKRDLERGLSAFDEMYRIHARDVDTGVGDALAQTMATARTFSTSALLGSAIIANLSDPFFQMWMKAANRMPAIMTIPRYFSAAANYPDFRQQVISNGIKWETLTNRAYEGTRYNLALEGSHWAKAISDINYRLQMLAQFTQTGRGVVGLDFADALARVKDMKFDDVPFNHLMRTLGITERDWNLVRDIPLYEPEYYSFGKGKSLRPIDMYEHAGSDEARAAANKFLMMQEQVVRDGIPMPNILTRQKLGEVLPAGELYTQFFKSMTQLMLFPASIHYQYWRRIFQEPNLKDKLKLAGLFMTYTTVVGAGITQAKDVLNGKNPHPMDTRGFWIRALLNGGAGGILGDMIYDSGLLVASPYGANTPLGQQLSNLKRLTTDNAKDYYAGKDLNLGADLARTAWGLFPFKLPGLKLVVERSIMDPLLKESDPAAYRRKVRAQSQWERDQGQGTWWGVGD